MKRKFRLITPILHNEAIYSAPDGTYVYIVSDKGFFANKVRSYMELGTIHRIVASDSQSSKVYFAGELRKKGEHVDYNLFSGTYTLVLLKLHPKIEHLEERMKTVLEQMFVSYGLTPTFQHTSYITPNTLTITEDELRLYALMGYNIRHYPTTEGYCSVEEITKLQGMIDMKQRTLKRLEALNATRSFPELEKDIQQLKKRMANAANCNRGSSLVSFATRKKRSRSQSNTTSTRRIPR